MCDAELNLCAASQSLFLELCVECVISSSKKSQTIRAKFPQSTCLDLRRGIDALSPSRFSKSVVDEREEGAEFSYASLLILR